MSVRFAPEAARHTWILTGEEAQSKNPTFANEEAEKFKKKTQKKKRGEGAQA